MAQMKPCTLDLDCVAPGSVLAADAHDAAGNVLLARGVTVTEAQLQALRRRGMVRLDVLVDVCEDADAGTAPVTQVEARLDYLFRHAEDSAAARELKRRILEFRRGQP